MKNSSRKLKMNGLHPLALTIQTQHRIVSYRIKPVEAVVAKHYVLYSAQISTRLSLSPVVGRLCDSVNSNFQGTLLLKFKTYLCFFLAALTEIFPLLAAEYYLPFSYGRLTALSTRKEFTGNDGLVSPSRVKGSMNEQTVESEVRSCCLLSSVRE